MSDVTIRQVEPAGPAIGFELVDEDVLTGGVGGWDSLGRPRRPAAAGWAGTPEQTYTLPLQLDGIEAGGVGIDRVVDGDCNQLDSWGHGSPTVDPPVLQVTGPLKAAPTTRWVLQDLAWGAVERNDAGQRIQQTVTVTLLAYVAPSLVQSHAKKAREKKAKKNKDKNPKKPKGK